MEEKKKEIERLLKELSGLSSSLQNETSTSTQSHSLAFSELEDSVSSRHEQTKGQLCVPRKTWKDSSPLSNKSTNRLRITTTTTCSTSPSQCTLNHRSQWKVCRVSGDIPLHRKFHCAVSYRERKFLLFGGYSGSHGECVWSLDTKDHEWKRIKTTKHAPIKRAGNCACVVDEFLIIFGGYPMERNTKKCLGDTWEFNITAEKWKCIHQTAKKSTEVSPCERYGHSCAAVDSVMYIFGGYNGDMLDDTWCYDSLHEEWMEIMESDVHPPAVYYHTMTLVNRREIYLFGGADANKVYNELWKFDVFTNTWEKYGPVDDDSPWPSPRHKHSTVAFGGELVVFGGSTETGMKLNDVWIYSTGTMEWYCISGCCSMRKSPSPRDGHSACRAGNRMYIFGGSSEASLCDDSWFLDLSSALWKVSDVKCKKISETGNVQSSGSIQSICDMHQLVSDTLSAYRQKQEGETLDDVIEKIPEYMSSGKIDEGPKSPFVERSFPSVRRGETTDFQVKVFSIVRQLNPQGGDSETIFSTYRKMYPEDDDADLKSDLIEVLSSYSSKVPNAKALLRRRSTVSNMDISVFYVFNEK